MGCLELNWDTMFYVFMWTTSMAFLRRYRFFYYYSIWTGFIIYYIYFLSCFSFFCEVVLPFIILKLMLFLFLGWKYYYLFLFVFHFYYMALYWYRNIYEVSKVLTKQVFPWNVLTPSQRLSSHPIWVFQGLVFDHDLKYILMDYFTICQNVFNVYI